MNTRFAILFLLLGGVAEAQTSTSGTALPAPPCVVGSVYKRTAGIIGVYNCLGDAAWHFMGRQAADGFNAALYLTGDGTWSAGSPPGTAAWGGITGTLSNQTDLQTALNAKEASGAFSGVGACGASTWASTLNDTAAPTCTQPAFTNISGSVTDGQVPDTITVSLAAAATALAADPADCATSTHFAVGVNASGVATCEAISDADVPDTITISLAATATALAADPADCATSTHFAVGVNASGVAVCEAISDADVPNTITVDLATLATTATTANAGDSATGFFSAGTVEIGVGGTGQATATAAFNALSPTTTAGDISYHNGTDDIRLAKGLEGQVLTINAGGTAPEWRHGGVTTLTSTNLQSDATIATYTAITGLAFTPVASGNYMMDCFIRYTSTVATTGINFAWDVPASVTSIHMSGYTTTTALGANEGFSQRADNVGTPTTAAVITVENVAVLSAQLMNGANATSTTLGFTPETANSVSVLVGSTCQVTRY